MAGGKEMKAIIALAGKIDPSLSAAISKTQAMVGNLDKDSTKSAKRGTSVVGKLAKAAVIATGAAAAAGGVFVAKSIKKGMEFDSAMSQVAATLGTTTDKIGDLRKFALEMGSTTAFTATQSAEALNYMALAGYDAETSMKMLPNVLNLAAAGSIDLAEASDMVTDAQSALGLSVEETNTLVDQMARTASKTNTSVGQLGEAILTVGGTAQYMAGGTAGVSAALGVLADNGIKASEGGTHLRNILLKLANPTSEATKLLDKMGVQVFDTQGKLKDFSEIFPQLNEAMSTMTDEEKLSALSTLFNARDIASATALLGTTKERWDEIGSALQNCEGAAQQMANTQLDNLEGDVTLFKSALEGAQIVLADKLNPTLREVVQFGTEAIGRLQSAAAEGGLAGFVGEAVSIVADAISAAVTALIEQLPSLIESVGGAIIAGLNQIGTSIAEALGIDQIPIIGDLFRNLAVVVMIAAGAFIAFKAAAAIGNIAEGIGDLASKFKGIGKGANKASAGMKGVGKAAGSSARNLMQVAVAALAVGAGIALAAVGFALLAQSAIALADAGPLAIGVMVGLVAAIALLAVGAAVLGPALDASALGLIAFGAAVLMVGAGIFLICAGITLLASSLPLVAEYGLQASVGFIALAGALVLLGPALLIAGVGAIVAGAGFLVLGVGAIVAGAGLLILGVGAIVAGAGLMVAAMGAMMAVAPVTMLMAVSMVAGAGLMVLGAGALVAGAGLIVFAAGAIMAGAAAVVLFAGVTVLAGGVTLLAGGVTLLAGGMALLAASVTATAAGLTAMATAIPTIAASAGAAAAGLTALAAASGLAAAGIGLSTGPLTALAAAALAASTAIMAAAMGMMMLSSGAMIAAMAMMMLAMYTPTAASGLMILAAASVMVAGSVGAAAPGLMTLASAAMMASASLMVAAAGMMMFGASIMAVTAMCTASAMAIIAAWTAVVAFFVMAWAQIAAAFRSGAAAASASAASIMGSLGGISSMLYGIVAAANSAASALRSMASAAASAGAAASVARAAGAGKFAKGGFTSGPSIAGEDPRYPTEAVISFNPAYRSQNIKYLQTAARMLGVTDYGMEPSNPGPWSRAISAMDGAGLSANVSYESNVTVGDINFAPNITVAGNASKDDIIAAIEEVMPEFTDKVYEALADAGVGDFGYSV